MLDQAIPYIIRELEIPVAIKHGRAAGVGKPIEIKAYNGVESKIRKRDGKKIFQSDPHVRSLNGRGHRLFPQSHPL